MSVPNTNDKFLETAKRRFDMASRAEIQMREDSSKATNFTDGNHWTDQEKQERGDKNKPIIVANKMRKVARRIANDIRQNLPRCRVIPANRKSQEGAEVLDELIRYIERISDAEDIYHNGLDQAVSGGYGYWRVTHDFNGETTFEQDIFLQSILNRDTVYFDPTAVKITKADADWCFITEIISKEEFKERYPGKKIPTATSNSASMSEMDQKWYVNDQVRVSEYFYKKPVTKKLGIFQNRETNDMFERELDGSPEITALEENGYEIVRQRKVKTHKVMWSLISGESVLETPREFPSKYIPIVPIMGNMEMVDGIMKIRSATHDAIDIQKAYDYILNKAIERLALSANTHYMATKTHIKGHEHQWNNLHKENYPYVMYNPDPQVPGGHPLKIPPIQTEVGALQQLIGLDNDIKDVTGAGEAFFGQRSNERTGVAIDARSLAASITLFTFASNFLKAIVYTGKIFLDMIPKVYDSERAMMIMGNKGELYDFVINRTVADINTLELVTINDVTDGEYDYVAEAGINFMTKLREFRQLIVELLGLAPEYRAVLLPMFLNTSEVPDKEELIAQINAITQRNNAIQEEQLRQTAPEQPQQGGSI